MALYPSSNLYPRGTLYPNQTLIFFYPPVKYKTGLNILEQLCDLNSISFSTNLGYDEITTSTSVKYENSGIEVDELPAANIKVREINNNARV
jgi:hypothetical protein